MQKSDQLDRTFRALGDATRRAIVERLTTSAEEPASVFVEMFDSSQPTTSKHLRVLEDAGLVQRRIVGRQHLFSLRAERFVEIDTWFERHGRFWNRSLDRLAAHLEEDET